MRQQKLLMALLALVLILGACKGESPTAPPSGGGGTTPPPTTTGVDMVLTASNATPLVDSTVIITATVTQNGQPVPNGTAVEFAVTEGAGFENTTSRAIIKTTTNGVATTSISSSVAGPVTVSATINNVTRTVTVNFQVRPTTPPPVNTTPSITSVTPAIGRPAGGEIIRIGGTNFRAPVRVLFDVGAALPIEATVVSVSATLIEVVSPGINLGSGQQLVTDIIVLTEAGTANEQRVEAEDAFTYRNEQLQPVLNTASPNSGPVTGGTRVSIYGEAFQAPVQVLFGAAEAKVITVTYNEILVEAPAGRDTADNGSGVVTGPVDVIVRNITSGTEATLTGGFRYIAAIDITSIHPNLGPATGGTDITIDGIGFLAPVEVTVGGLTATVLRVSGTQILARTTPSPNPCATSSFTVQVKNVANGDFEIYGDGPEEQPFTYVGVLPLITSVSPASGVEPGGNLSVLVRDPGIGPLGFADVRFTLNNRSIIPSPSQITDGDGTTTFNVAVPTTGFSFPTVACTTGGGLAGSQFGPLELPITFNNITTSCADTTTVVIIPDSDTNPCLTSPRPIVTEPPSGCANPGPATVGANATLPLTTTAEIEITNQAGSLPLNITNVAISGSAASEFRISPTTATGIAGGGSQTFIVTFDPITPGTKEALVTFTTNSAFTPTITVCVQATGAL
ncbi:MAG TPA: IPT/TIG domain-containing protein [Thermoanaerobaculia bacterium]|nr:IPT/TIG domain-containing protein [Thermoanaerobaculia bacterium]